MYGDAEPISTIFTAREGEWVQQALILGPSKHTFGGKNSYRGAIPPGYVEPIHLLYRLDLDDPEMHLSLPSARFLPLLYPFRYSWPPTWYRVLSDDEIQIADETSTRFKWEETFPYPGYPTYFPLTPIRIGSSVKPVANPAELEEFKENFDDDMKDFNDLILYRFGLPQGIGDTPCINPECGKHRVDCLALVFSPPVPGVDLWKPEDVVVTFEMCSKCNLIYSSNQLL